MVFRSFMIVNRLCGFDHDQGGRGNSSKRFFFERACERATWLAIPVARPVANRRYSRLTIGATWLGLAVAGNLSHARMNFEAGKGG